MDKSRLSKNLSSFCKELIGEFDLISEERTILLERLSKYIFDKKKVDLPVNIIVICTHNSRRSHIGQLWLQIASIWYGIDNVQTFSGGTEATAFNYRSVEALRRAGLDIDKITKDQNPIYRLSGELGLSYSNDLFSKKYDSKPNPIENFAAIMVCTEADKGCPIVRGADGRFPIPFEDPKRFDDTDLEKVKYDERVRQIGREFFYVMNYANQCLVNQ